MKFYIIKFCIPFTDRGYPMYNVLTWYRSFTQNAINYINYINPDLIHAHGTEGAYSYLASKQNYPTLVSIQGIISEICKKFPTLFLKIQKYFEIYAIKNNKNFACRTKFDSNFVKFTNKIANIYYLPEAVNPIFFKYAWDKDGANGILFVGSLLPRKGIEILIKAIYFAKKEIPNIKLRIIGTGDKNYVEYLKNTIVKLRLMHNIIWLGYQPSESIAEYLLKSKLFVLPTFIDNSPNSISEAMTIGTPIIASNIGGIPSMLNKKALRRGLFKHIGAPQKLANKIVEMYYDTNLQTDMSYNGRIIARRIYSPHKVSKKAIDIYKKILSQY